MNEIRILKSKLLEGHYMNIIPYLIRLNLNCKTDDDTYGYTNKITKILIFTCDIMIKGGFEWTVHLTYFLSHIIVSNLTAIAIFTLIIDKYTVYPNPH